MNPAEARAIRFDGTRSKLFPEQKFFPGLAMDHVALTHWMPCLPTTTCRRHHPLPTTKAKFDFPRIPDAHPTFPTQTVNFALLLILLIL